MTGSEPFQEFSVFGWLTTQMKRLAATADGTSELRHLDDQQVGEIAHDLGLSRAELFALCGNRASGALLKQRLAQFGLTEESLAKRHPEVLQDLQRVCGTCTTTTRCARDFAAHRDVGRDEYCPNTCTLNALKEEGMKHQAGSCSSS